MTFGTKAGDLDGLDVHIFSMADDWKMDEVSVTIGNAMYTMAKLETVRYIRERGRQSLVTCSTGKRIATMAGLHITPIGVSRPCQVQSARSTLSQGVQRRPNGKSARNLVMQAAVRQRLGNRAGRQVEEEDVAVEEEEEELDEEEIDGVDLGADEPAAAVVAAGTEAVPEASTAAGAAGSKDARVYEPPTYALNFLWLEKNIAVAVDQVFTKDARAPLSEYFFWPRKDAWEELKATLEAKPWISERDKVLLLNRTTEVINFWQSEGEKHTLAEAQEQFPDCTFMGA